jgi:hypothetical protein
VPVLSLVLADQGLLLQHLVVKAITRTPKFLQALPNAPYFVTVGWLQACIEAKAIVGEFLLLSRRMDRVDEPKSHRPADETPYLLEDPDSEEKYGFRLSEALERAEELKENGGLLHNMSFYVVRLQTCTPATWDSQSSWETTSDT